MRGARMLKPHPHSTPKNTCICQDGLSRSMSFRRTWSGRGVAVQWLRLRGEAERRPHTKNTMGILPASRHATQAPNARRIWWETPGKVPHSLGSFEVFFFADLSSCHACHASSPLLSLGSLPVARGDIWAKSSLRLLASQGTAFARQGKNSNSQ